MSEVYDLAMRIGVTGDVLQTLSRISSQLSEVATKVQGLSTNFLTLGKNVGLLGGAMSGLGIATGLMLDKMASYYGTINDKQRALVAGGHSWLEAQEAYNEAAKTARDLNMETNEIFNIRRGLTGVLNAERAGQLTPEIAAVQKALISQQDPSDIMKYIQMWAGQGLTNAQIMERVNQALSVSANTQGRVSFEAFADLQKRLPDMAYSFRSQQLPVIAEKFANLGGYGGAGMALAQEFIAALKDKKDVLGQAVAAGGANLGNIQNNPYAILQAIRRGMEAQGTAITPESVDRKLVELGLANARTLPVMRDMMLRGGPGSLYEQPQRLTDAAAINQIHEGSLTDVHKSAAAAIERIFTAIGNAGLTEGVASRWVQLVEALKGIERWIDSLSPEQVTTITNDLFYLSAGLVGLGTALLFLGGLAGLTFLVGPAGLIALLVAGLIALSAADYGGIVSGLDAVEKAVQSFGQKLREWLGLSKTSGPDLLDKSWAGVGKSLDKFFGTGTPALAAPGGTPSVTDRFGGLNLLRGADAAISPRGEGRPITAVTNLNMSGRLVASVIQNYMIQMNSLSGGAAASNGAAIPIGPDGGSANN